MCQRLAGFQANLPRGSLSGFPAHQANPVMGVGSLAGIAVFQATV
jgi:hypothetical protein